MLLEKRTYFLPEDVIHIICIHIAGCEHVWRENILDFRKNKRKEKDWLIALCLTALSDNISVYIGPSNREM